MQKILFLSLFLTLIAIQCESTPIFDHIKQGFDKAHHVFHQFTCKIKDHRGCETKTITTESIPTTIDPVDMIDIRAGNDQDINLIPLTTNEEDIYDAEAKRIINVNTCADGYRRDRSGVCRQIY
nr:uncharacterized protein LOC111418060 [Onthophagus taurus]